MLNTNSVETPANTSILCPPAAAWSTPRPFSALVGASVYPHAVGAGFVEYAQKRFAMKKGDIDGWPLGPRDGTSG